jgi:AraC-like DNA-binding protein
MSRTIAPPVNVVRAKSNLRSDPVDHWVISYCARGAHLARLLEAHAVLSDRATKKSVSAVAEDLCFADASSFSRAFKREFGHSPGEVRSAALAGLALPEIPRRSEPSAGADFGELLRGS